MAHDIPTTEPVTLTAGDTATWTKSLPDYLPEDGWVLSYALVNADGQIAFSSTDNGDSTHLISVAASSTANWTAGIYNWQSYVTNGGERYTIERGEITIKSDFASQTTYDARSALQQALDAHEAALATRPANGVIEVSHGDRVIKYESLEALIAAIQKLRAEVKREEIADKIANGEGIASKVYVRLKV